MLSAVLNGTLFLSAKIWARTGTQQNTINQTVTLYNKDEFDCTVRITDSESVTGRESVFVGERWICVRLSRNEWWSCDIYCI